MRLCSGAGCGRAVPDDVRFCDACKAERDTDAHKTTGDIRVHTLTDRIKYAFLYSSARWTKLRNIVIRSQPLCSRCRIRLSSIVDHTVPAGVAIAECQASGRFVDRWAGFFLKSNLQGLCRECHYQKTEEDKAHGSTWPSVLERSKS